jgi:hypothetical protein
MIIFLVTNKSQVIFFTDSSAIKKSMTVCDPLRNKSQIRKYSYTSEITCHKHNNEYSKINYSNHFSQVNYGSTLFFDVRVHVSQIR